MNMLFLFCALTGGTILVCQMVTTLLGIGGQDSDAAGHGGAELAHDIGHDIGHDLSHDTGTGHDSSTAADHAPAHHHSSTWLFGVLSFRTLVAALTFFGIGGLAAISAGLHVTNQLLISLACAVGAMYLVHWLLSLLYRLSEDHTVRVQRALGHEGTVYIPVPAGKSGAGKIQLQLQGRLMEYAAVTSAPADLPTGARVVVVGVREDSTLEVAVPEDRRVVSGEA